MRLEGGAQVEAGCTWAGWWWGEVGFVTWGLVTGWILGEGGWLQGVGLWVMRSFTERGRPGAGRAESVNLAVVLVS